MTVAELDILVAQLAHLRAASDDDQKWAQVEDKARSVANAIADGLRANDPVQDKLGKSGLPDALSTLLQQAIAPDGIPRGLKAQSAFQLLRVGANLCIDHDANRERLLDVKYLEHATALLEAYSASPAHNEDNFPLEDIKIAKIAIGGLINASLGLHEVRTRLSELRAPLIVLRLANVVYRPGKWASLQITSSPELTEEWKLRSGFADWACKFLERYTEQDDTPSFSPSDLDLLLISLRPFIPPFPTPIDIADKSLKDGLLNADLKSLENVSMFLESVTLDVADARISLAQGAANGIDDESTPPLKQLTRFVEDARPPPYWASSPEGDRKRWEKTLSTCKGAIVKTIIAIAGDDTNMALLWGSEEESGGWFVKKMIEWVPAAYTNVDASPEIRDDLSICATLTLGNIIRKDSYSAALVPPPNSIIPKLLPLLDPQADIKVKHGAISLLKNLAICVSNRKTMGEAGVIEKLTESRIWTPSADMAGTVQISAIGVVKHLCASNIANTLRLLSPVGSEMSGMDQLFGIIDRSETLALRSEATRVLANIVRSLCSANNSTGEAAKEDREEGLAKITHDQAASALAEMVARSRKYPVLLNEGVVALTLLGARSEGAPLVVRALETPLETDVSNSRHPPITPLAQGPPILSALDMLAVILSSPERAFPPELRANVCALLGTVGKDAATVRDATRTAVRALAEANANVNHSAAAATTGSGQEKLVRAAAARTLEMWAQKSQSTQNRPQ
ncbi:hypothetical protein BOTBODRAFT_38392 [Botryobasidium botryosum FD-172 SS1]|uniref:Uncharacterized protein n=1 Tax=Botryobasidium botryosum (strain FD-172 SS1) TaxID=930990 RepID=A0A067LZX9_BOTB1|nr:hypothetical protein BOTBODRAFT_38392 [Botryobasidium botryosum FD-172 SS1]